MDFESFSWEEKLRNDTLYSNCDGSRIVVLLVFVFVSDLCYRLCRGCHMNLWKGDRLPWSLDRNLKGKNIRLSRGKQKEYVKLNQRK